MLDWITSERTLATACACAIAVCACLLGTMASLFWIVFQDWRKRRQHRKAYEEYEAMMESQRLEEQGRRNGERLQVMLDLIASVSRLLRDKSPESIRERLGCTVVEVWPHW